MGLPVQVHKKVAPRLRCVERYIRAHLHRARRSATRRAPWAASAKPTPTAAAKSRTTCSASPSTSTPTATRAAAASRPGPTTPPAESPAETVFERTALPRCWIDAFERFGFYWLGRDPELRDTMHFEFLGDPELVSARNRAFARRYPPPPPTHTGSGQGRRNGHFHEPARRRRRPSTCSPRLRGAPRFGDRLRRFREAGRRSSRRCRIGSGRSETRSALARSAQSGPEAPGSRRRGLEHVERRARPALRTRLRARCTPQTPRARRGATRVAAARKMLSASADRRAGSSARRRARDFGAAAQRAGAGARRVDQHAIEISRHVAHADSPIDRAQLERGQAASARTSA